MGSTYEEAHIGCKEVEQEVLPKAEEDPSGLHPSHHQGDHEVVAAVAAEEEDHIPHHLPYCPFLVKVVLQGLQEPRVVVDGLRPSLLKSSHLACTHSCAQPPVRQQQHRYTSRSHTPCYFHSAGLL